MLGVRTSSNCLLDPPQPICYTKYLERRRNIRLQQLVWKYVFRVLYSFPVCTASVFTTSPGLTCFLAGFSFLGGFGACGIGIGSGGRASAAVLIVALVGVKCDL